MDCGQRFSTYERTDIATLAEKRLAEASAVMVKTRDELLRLAAQINPRGRLHGGKRGDAGS